VPDVIKFKAWSRIHNRFMEVDHVASFTHIENGVLNVSPNVILIQFSNILDKNDNEIYDGTVVEYLKEVYIVKKIHGSYLLFYPNSNKVQHGLYIANKHSPVVILGNIFENPEFLNIDITKDVLILSGPYRQCIVRALKKGTELYFRDDEKNEDIKLCLYAHQNTN